MNPDLSPQTVFSFRILLHVVLYVFLLSTSATADEYEQRREAIQARDARQRKVPEIPGPGERIRCIIDTDAKNEIDDVWAIALAVLCQDRFQVEGFIGANYDNAIEDAGPGSPAASVKVIETVLAKAGLAGKIPVMKGSAPLQYKFEPSESEGVDFIIERAMASSSEDPLWVIGLGAATDIASAYLKEPRIADRVCVFWHFRTRWPDKCWNFNVIGDVRAARVVFHGDLPFVLFDTGTHLTCPMEESRQWAELSKLGKYMHEYRKKRSWYQDPNKGFYDLGDIAALVDPELASWEIVECPEVDWDLNYRFKNTKGRILRCKDIDRDKTYALLDGRLRRHAERK
ncbi:MAG: nucleoside hydrolase [Planctomycetota bacterium]